MNFKLMELIFLYSYILLIVSFYTCESKLVYKCQNGFTRFGRDCYYSSIKTATWQDALFECENLAKGSKLVILPRPVDDHNFRKFLKYRKIETQEIWIGGIYDWKQDLWKWAATGQTIRFNNFETMPNFGDEENDHWQCIAIDPNYEYKWTAHSCLQEKYFVCKTKPQPMCTNSTDLEH